MVEERVIPEEEPQPITEPVKEEEEDLSDMFEVPKQGYEREDVSDLFEVSEEDAMGEDEEAEDLFEVSEEAEEPEAESEPVKVEPHWSDEDIKRYEKSQRPQVVRKPIIRRTTKPYTPPDQISGTR